MSLYSRLRDALTAARAAWRGQPVRPAIHVPAPTPESMERIFTRLGAGDALPPQPARNPSEDIATRYAVKLPAGTQQPTGMTMAKDAASFGVGGLAGQVALSALSFVDQVAFPGFPLLVQLSQLPQYRNPAAIIATEATRKWGKVVGTGDVDPAKVEKLEAAMRTFRVQDALHEACLHDGFFGRGHIFVRMKGSTPADLPLLRKPQTIPKGKLEAFVAMDPTYMYPGVYEAQDMTKAEFYRPEVWYALATPVHHTRVFTLVSRPVPYLLRPAYTFAGVSLTQLIMESTNNFLSMRQSVADVVKSFSVSGVKTEMASTLSAGGVAAMTNRAEMFNRFRSNRNLLLLDKDTEEYFMHNVPLSGLNELLQQAQEQMASDSGIPPVKLFGDDAEGMNANSTGAMRSFAENIAAYQKSHLKPIVCGMLEIIQLDAFGEIDLNITFEFAPLQEMDDLQISEVRLKNAQAAAVWESMGAISGAEERVRLASDGNSGYNIELTNSEVDPEINELERALHTELGQLAIAQEQGEQAPQQSASVRGAVKTSGAKS